VCLWTEDVRVVRRFMGGSKKVGTLGTWARYLAVFASAAMRTTIRMLHDGAFERDGLGPAELAGQVGELPRRF
jgi:hypothetical protein